MTDKDPHLLKTPIAKQHDSANSSNIDTSANTNTDADITDSVEDATITHKGTETLKSEYGETEHIKSGDNPARQPDLRDQTGQWFDDNINENNPEVKSVLDDTPKSEEINEQNRYASIDNAQKRVLPTEDQKPS